MNLYDFLRRAATDLHIYLTNDERQWLESYLQAPEVQVHFKAKQVGSTPESAVMAQDYAICGAESDVKELLAEAALISPRFGTALIKAARLVQMIPTCKHCNHRHLQINCPDPNTWNFPTDLNNTNGSEPTTTDSH